MKVFLTTLVLLFLLTFFLSFPFAAVGLWRPKLLRFIFRKNPTRKLIVISFLIVVVISLIGMGSIIEGDSKDFPAQKISSSLPTPTTMPIKIAVTQKPTRKIANIVHKPTPTLTAKQQEEQLAAQRTNEKVSAYKTEVFSLIAQFEKEDQILNQHMPQSIYYDYKNDSTYQQLYKAYTDINDQNSNNANISPVTTYDEIFSDTTDLMATALHDLVMPEDYQQQYPRVAEVQTAIKRCERDIEIAKNNFDKLAYSTNEDEIESTFDPDHFQGADTETAVLNYHLEQAVIKPDQAQ